MVLVTHGLNMKPEVMDELVTALARNQLHCLRISLYHDGLGRRADPAVIADGWVGCVRDGYHEARTRFPGLPVHCLGFSIGALITLRFLDVDEDAAVDRMMLLAPPVGLTRMSKLIRPLVPLRRIGLVLPSAAPRATRARRGTPFSEYGALLRTHDALQTLDHPGRFRSVPTRILVDADDELVSYTAIRRWMAANGLDASWTAELIGNRQVEGRTYRHLVVTQDALGQRAWNDLLTKTIDHLTGPLPANA